jgi:hypothetical protein
MSAPTLTLDEGRRIEMMSNSYTRFANVIMLWPKMRREHWWTLLGEAWTCCDNISRYTCSRYGINPLDGAERADLDLMMDAEERRAFAALPEEITVYRGCYKNNKKGLSWTLRREIAERFPTLMRYRQRGLPLLLIGTAHRSRCVLKLGRNEDEIICADVRVIKVESIDATVEGHA